MSLALQGVTLLSTVRDDILDDTRGNQAIAIVKLFGKVPVRHFVTYRWIPRSYVQSPNLCMCRRVLEYFGFPFGAVTSQIRVLRALIWYRSTYDSFYLGLGTITDEAAVLSKQTDQHDDVESCERGKPVSLLPKVCE
jgi:hypothetical protein